MTKNFVLVLILVALSTVAIAQTITITEDWESPPYFWIPYNDGILASTEVGGISGIHGYLLHPSTMGDWIPDPTSGLWEGISGTPSQWFPTTQPIITGINPLTMEPYQYDYALSNPENPYERTARLYSYVTGYTGNFWNSYNHSWYAGDVTGGYLISAEPVNLSVGGTLSMTVLKLGTGSGSTFVDYAPTPDGPWLHYGTFHNITHAGSDWTPYSVELDPLGTAGASVYLRISFRSNVAGGPQTAPFLPLANFWMDDFQLTVIGDDPELPVELSSFTAVVTAQDLVQINWITQSETNVSGYYVYRNTTNNLEFAQQVSPLVGATNTSQQQHYTFVDQEVETGQTYYYWLQSRELSGETNFYGPTNVVLTGGSGPSTPEIPTVTKLHDAYPNPFRPSTNLSYSLKAPGTVRIEVYNLKGQLIWSTTQSHTQAGYFYSTWNGKDMNGTPVSSGIYSYKMTSENYTSTKKVVLVK